MSNIIIFIAIISVIIVINIHKSYIFDENYEFSKYLTFSTYKLLIFTLIQRVIYLIYLIYVSEKNWVNFDELFFQIYVILYMYCLLLIFYISYRIVIEINGNCKLIVIEVLFEKFYFLNSIIIFILALLFLIKNNLAINSELNSILSMISGTLISILVSTNLTSIYKLREEKKKWNETRDFFIYHYKKILIRSKISLIETIFINDTSFEQKIIYLSEKYAYDKKDYDSFNENNFILDYHKVLLDMKKLKNKQIKYDQFIEFGNRFTNEKFKITYLLELTSYSCYFEKIRKDLFEINNSIEDFQTFFVDYKLKTEKNYTDEKINILIDICSKFLLDLINPNFISYL